MYVSEVTQATCLSRNEIYWPSVTKKTQFSRNVYGFSYTTRRQRQPLQYCRNRATGPQELIRQDVTTGEGSDLSCRKQISGPFIL